MDGVGFSISPFLNMHSASKLNDSNWSTGSLVDKTLVLWFLSSSLTSSFSLDNMAIAVCIPAYSYKCLVDL